MDFAFDLRTYISTWFSSALVDTYSPCVCYENDILQRTTDYLEPVCWINNIFRIFPDLQQIFAKCTWQTRYYEKKTVQKSGNGQFGMK